MRKLETTRMVAAAVVLLFTAAPLAAQQPAAHSLAPDAWALQFGVTQNLTLGAFAGGVISAQHHRTADRALRYGLTFATQHLGRDDQANQTQVQFAAVAHLLNYPTLATDPGGSIHMFWGVGPLLRYMVNRITPLDGDAVTDQLLSLGASGTIGAQWFVRQRIALSAEYQSALLVGFGTDRWLFQLGQDGVRFGASVYFP